MNPHTKKGFKNVNYQDTDREYPISSASLLAAPEPVALWERDWHGRASESVHWVRSHGGLRRAGGGGVGEAPSVLTGRLR
jgi:hypothetical protein